MERRPKQFDNVSDYPFCQEILLNEPEESENKTFETKSRVLELAPTRERDVKNQFSFIQNSREYLESSGSVRWIILGLSCFIMFGNYYAFDNPSALNRQLRAWMGDRSEAEFEYHLNLLYTVYSAPNVILPFMVGRSLDRYGSRFFLIGLSVLMCLGQTAFAVGVGSKSWSLMMIGRLVFGLGGESLAVAQSRLVTEWFLGKELGLAIGMNLSVARIGTVFNNNLSPRIAGGDKGVSGACWVGLGTCLFSLACTFACVLIDAIYRPASKDLMKSSLSGESVEEANVDADANLVDKFHDEYFIHYAFYFLLFMNFLSYGAVLCFNTVASAYLQERYFPANVLGANWAMSVPDTAAIFMVPLIGLGVDRTGWKLGTIGIGQLALACGHLWLALGRNPARPFAALFILGIGYSTLLAIWSCVPFLVGSKRQATAYGFLTSSTNLSTTVLPILVAALITADQSYLLVGLFFSLLGVFGLVICVYVSSINRVYSLNLNGSRVPAHMTAFFQVKPDPKGPVGLKQQNRIHPTKIFPDFSTKAQYNKL
jgi:MFS family permease